VGSLFQRDPTALPILLRIFSASQYLSDLLIRDTESYDNLRLTEGQLYSRRNLVDELVNSMSAAQEWQQALHILRRFKHRETLRIGFGDLVVGHRLDQVIEQISILAESIIEAAWFFANRKLVERWGQPEAGEHRISRFAILALGKLGGNELNYSSDIDLITVYESPGKTSLTGKSNQAFFEQLTRDIMKLLNEPTSLGAAYRVDLRLRPEGSRGPASCSADSFVQYYDLHGRTWERQALIKARPVAADLDFGEWLLSQLATWVYRPILNRFDIAGIKALKRQIEHRTLLAGEEKTNIKTGHGGIRDIEFVIQFLQLLNGSEKSVRTGNTLQAIQRLAAADCLSRQEADLLTQNYSWLRRLEHLLQIMFDLQTHTLPEDDQEVSKLAIRLGYRDYFGISALRQFRADFAEIADTNRQILNHLLHHAFDSDEADEDGELNAVDLVLQPELSADEVASVLSQYGIRNPEAGSRLIASLATESTVFFSSRRCRHFLAAVIRPLLAAVAQTPAPDETLVTLSGVADAIGGKGVLWELFSFNPASLGLFVRLCASSDYLCSLVKRNPGMVDELVDSLLMKSLPSLEWLGSCLNELVGGAVDCNPILHSFKNAQHLRAGIRDIIGRDPVRETHRFLSDVAEVCLEKIAEKEFLHCANRYRSAGSNRPPADSINRLIVLAMGKLGGREPNYHSDLDVVFLYDSSDEDSEWLATSPQHFYSELAAKITKAITATGPTGKLYDLDSRLRPTGRSGALAVSLAEFQRYFTSGSGQLWERQSLCKSRPILGNHDLQRRVRAVVGQIIAASPWRPEMAAEIYAMRMKLQENCNPENLKRGAGGTVDIEFAVQMLQLKYAAAHPEVVLPGTIDAIDALSAIDGLERDDGLLFIEGYQFLRGVESRLRLMNTTARHDLPNGQELEKLAYLLRTPAGTLASQVSDYRRRIRERFESIFRRER
jgi:glutamate-ammonia-ligase adenylyltransferase